jgi:hypothetical protein
MTDRSVPDPRDVTIAIAKAICDHERGVGQWDAMIAVLAANRKKRPGEAEARFLATANAVLAVIQPTPETPCNATIARLSAELADAKSKLYVPGRWRCPKCNFGLSQFKLRASDGAIGVSDTPGEKCPNCDTPLWRVTEREAGDELAERCQEQMLRATKAEADLAEAREALAPFVEEFRARGESRDWNEKMPGTFPIQLYVTMEDGRRARAVLAKLAATEGT